MFAKVHIISSFICLHCCKQFRMEIGLLENFVFGLRDMTFEEVMDEFPEVMEEMERDEFQKSVFSRFIFEHGPHDVRFLYTPVDHMSRIVEMRAGHYKQVISLYQQYQAVGRSVKNALQQSGIFHPPTLKNKENRFYWEGKKKR